MFFNVRKEVQINVELIVDSNVVVRHQGPVERFKVLDGVVVYFVREYDTDINGSEVFPVGFSQWA